MNLLDFIRQRTLVDGCRQVVLTRLPDAQWQASLLHAKGSVFSVEIHGDPVDALWNVLVPLHLRHATPETAPSADESDLGDLLG